MPAADLAVLLDCCVADVDGLAEEVCWELGVWLGVELGVGLDLAGVEVVVDVCVVLVGMASPDSGSQIAVRLAITLIPPPPWQSSART